MVNLFGYYLSFAVQRYNVRQSMRQVMRLQKMKNTTRFVFTAGEYGKLTKFDGGKEFSLNGCMYDVVKKEVNGGQVILFAYYDHRETGVIDSFLAYFKEDAPQGSSESLRQFSLQEFVVFYSGWKSQISYAWISFIYYDVRQLCYSIITPVSPPPDWVS